MLDLLSNWRLIIGGILLAAVVGLGLALKSEIADNGALSASLTVANQTAKDNAEQVTVLQAAMIERERAVSAAQAKQAAAEKRAASIIQEVRHAEDGPVAPALAVALDRLRADRGRAEGATGQGGGAATANRAN